MNSPTVSVTPYIPYAKITCWKQTAYNCIIVELMHNVDVKLSKFAKRTSIFPPLKRGTKGDFLIVTWIDYGVILFRSNPPNPLC